MSLIRSSSALAAILFVAAFGLGAPARAEAPCEDRPRVQVQVEAASGSSLVRRTVDLVTAELTARRTPCDASSEGRNAQIVVRFLDASRVRIEVELSLEGRKQRALRDVDHTTIPSDGIPAALAIAADELLRAVYEQTGIESLEEPARTGASPEVEVVEPLPIAVTERHPKLLGIALAGEIFPGDRSLIGPEARFAFPLGSKLMLEAHLGLRALVPAVEPEPRVHLARLWILGLNARWEVVRPAKTVGMSAILGADALFHLDASPRVRPALRAGLRGFWDPGASMRLEAGIDSVWLPMALRTSPNAEPFVSGVGVAPSLSWLVQF